MQLSSFITASIIIHEKCVRFPKILPKREDGGKGLDEEWFHSEDRLKHFLKGFKKCGRIGMTTIRKKFICISALCVVLKYFHVTFPVELYRLKTRVRAGKETRAK